MISARISRIRSKTPRAVPPPPPAPWSFHHSEKIRQVEGAVAVLRSFCGTDQIALFLEHGEAVARREGEELRFAREDGAFRTRGETTLLDHPDALERTWAALHNPNAGEVLVSATPGFEFLDLAGRHHAGGGSHGSLVAGDSEVPMLTVGLGPPPASITGVAPLVLHHFGIEPPRYASKDHLRHVAA
jgi:hypothetical protein